jgi:hypothetical protein
MLPPGTRFSKGHLSRGKTQCDWAMRSFQERRESGHVEVVATNIGRPTMRHKLHLSALIAIAMIGASAPALAQGAGAAAQTGSTPGVGTNPPVGAPANPAAAGISSAPGGASTTTTGMGAGINQPGVPNTSTPGIIGTGAAPSGLPGDDPAHPGFPGKVGQ